MFGIFFSDVCENTAISYIVIKLLKNTAVELYIVLYDPRFFFPFKMKKSIFYRHLLYSWKYEININGYYFLNLNKVECFSNLNFIDKRID